MHVLIVDEDGSVRHALTQALEGHRVSDASNGAQALAVLAAESIDVILLDVTLSGPDGISTLTRIRGSGVKGKVPVVMLSRRAGEIDHMKAYRAGADAYVVRPFDPAELGMILTEVAARTPAERERRRIAELSRAELLRQVEVRLGGSPPPPDEPVR